MPIEEELTDDLKSKKYGNGVFNIIGNTYKLYGYIEDEPDKSRYSSAYTERGCLMTTNGLYNGDNISSISNLFNDIITIEKIFNQHEKMYKENVLYRMYFNYKKRKYDKERKYKQDEAFTKLVKEGKIKI